ICSLMLIDAKKQELWTCVTQSKSARYIEKPNIKIWEGVSGRAIREHRSIEVSDVRLAADYRYPQAARAEGVASFLSVPIKIGKYAIGVLNGYTSGPHKFAEEEVAVFNTVANVVALAFENAVLREENVA